MSYNPPSEPEKASGTRNPWKNDYIRAKQTDEQHQLIGTFPSLRIFLRYSLKSSTMKAVSEHKVNLTPFSFFVKIDFYITDTWWNSIRSFLLFRMEFESINKGSDLIVFICHRSRRLWFFHGGRFRAPL